MPISKADIEKLDGMLKNKIVNPPVIINLLERREYRLHHIMNIYDSSFQFVYNDGGMEVSSLLNIVVLYDEIEFIEGQNSNGETVFKVAR